MGNGNRIPLACAPRPGAITREPCGLGGLMGEFADCVGAKCIRPDQVERDIRSGGDESIEWKSCLTLRQRSCGKLHTHEVLREAFAVKHSL